jgi:membrane fusion protein (multidrug efflux system)
MDNQTPVKKKSPVRFIILGVLLIAGGYFGYTKWKYATTHESTDNAQVETTLVPVLPRVSGYIKEVTVKDYDSVNTGQLLVVLDDAEMQAQLMEMEADLRSAEADIVNAEASVQQARVSLGGNKGSISLNQIRLQKAEQDLKRDENLFAENAITKKQLEDSRFDVEQAKQQEANSGSDLSSAQSKIAILQANVTKSQAAIELKRARIEQQKLKISYTKIYAPAGGKLGKKNISLGQFVQAGTPLFTIVNDSTYWIVANFKENQIERMHPGMEVNIELDAYPDLPLKGSIESLSDATGAKFALLPPDNASGNFVKVTQRVPVKIAIKDAAKIKDKLRAGLSVKVEVPLQ